MRAVVIVLLLLFGMTASVTAYADSSDTVCAITIVANQNSEIPPDNALNKEFTACKPGNILSLGFIPRNPIGLNKQAFLLEYCDFSKQILFNGDSLSCVFHAPRKFEVHVLK